MLSAEEKKRFLKALEKDEEFRYAVGGLIGYKEILDRITSIEERIVKLEERVVKLEERVIKLEEGQQRLERGQQRLERLVNVIAHRFGVITEESFKEGMKAILEEELGTAEVSRLTMKDEEGGGSLRSPLRSGGGYPSEGRCAYTRGNQV